MLPGLHPRMASEQHGPTVSRQLEPPGFLALNYGMRTPIAVVLSHIVFGMIIGGFYRVSLTLALSCTMPLHRTLACAALVAASSVALRRWRRRAVPARHLLRARLAPRRRRRLRQRRLAEDARAPAELGVDGSR